MASFSDMDLGTFTLVRDMQALDEVVVTGTMKPMSRSDSPVSVEVITPELFRKERAWRNGGHRRSPES